MGLANSCINPTKSINDELLQYQDTIPDSIQYRLSSYFNYAQQINYLLSLSEDFLWKDPKLAFLLAENAGTIAQKAGYPLAYAETLYWKAFIINQSDPQSIELQKALTTIQIANEIFKRKANEKWIAKALNLQALIYYNLYQEDKGAIFNKEAIKILTESNKSKEDLPIVWGDIFRTEGNIELYTNRQLDSVLVYFDKSLALYKLANDSMRIARLLANYAFIYDLQDQFEEADSVFVKAISIYDKINNLRPRSMIYLDYATFLANRFKYSRARKWFNLSKLWLDRTIQLNPIKKTEIFFQYGANYQNLALYTKSQDTLFYDSARYYYHQALHFGVKEKNIRYIKKTVEEIAKICPEISSKICRRLLKKSTNSLSAALDSTTKSIKQSASITEQFREREMQYNYERLFNISATVILFIITVSLFFFQYSRIKFLRKQLIIKLEALRAQMNPHFISNSLNAIDSLINQNRNEEASEYIIDFSRLCRLILYNSKHDLITLEKEIETLSYYLSLEQLRMPKKLQYTLSVNPALDVKQILIPPMVIQPFIENAIIHGIQNKQTKGNINILLEKELEQIKCIIQDDGVGRVKAKAIKARSIIERPSWGIQITQERIDAIKKIQGSSIEIIDLKNPDGEAIGTKVIVTLPLLYKNKITQ